MKIKNLKINQKTASKLVAFTLAGSLVATTLTSCGNNKIDREEVLKAPISENTRVITFDDGSRDIALAVGKCEMAFNKFDHYYSITTGEYFSDKECRKSKIKGNIAYKYDVVKDENIADYLTDDELIKSLKGQLNADETENIIRRIITQNSVEENSISNNQSEENVETEESSFDKTFKNYCDYYSLYDTSKYESDESQKEVDEFYKNCEEQGLIVSKDKFYDFVNKFISYNNSNPNKSISLENKTIDKVKYQSLFNIDLDGIYFNTDYTDYCIGQTRKYNDYRFESSITYENERFKKIHYQLFNANDEISLRAILDLNDNNGLLDIGYKNQILFIDFVKSEDIRKIFSMLKKEIEENKDFNLMDFIKENVDYFFEITKDSSVYGHFNELVSDENQEVLKKLIRK